MPTIVPTDWCSSTLGLTSRATSPRWQCGGGWCPCEQRHCQCLTTLSAPQTKACLHAGVTTTCLTTCGPESSTPALQRLPTQCATVDSLVQLPAAVSHQVNWESCFAYHIVGAKIHVVFFSMEELSQKKMPLLVFGCPSGLPGSHLRIKLPQHKLPTNCSYFCLHLWLFLLSLSFFLSYSTLFVCVCLPLLV